MKNIIKRISTRNYTDEGLSVNEEELVKKILSQEYKSIFGHKLEVKLVDQKFMKKNKVKRVGTYGFITGNPSFIFAGIESNQESYIDYGYVIEHMVLKLTDQGFETCWLGGTFSRKVLFKLYKLTKEVTIPAVVSVGKKSNKKSFVQNLMGSNFHNRRPFETLFFENQINNPLKVEKAGAFREPLEALRLAPSVMNLQPWRVLIEENKAHFYCETTSMNQMKYVDIGIGLSHFDYITEKNKTEGNWEVLNIPSHKNLAYMISFIAS